MPIYAYKCTSCGHTEDVMRKISDAPLTTCTACGKETFEKQLTALDKTKPTLVHCQAGGRSMRALKVFEKLGFTQLIHLDDGFGGWEAAGKPVEK